jgi:hypothetical protein
LNCDPEGRDIDEIIKGNSIWTTQDNRRRTHAASSRASSRQKKSYFNMKSINNL